jgi:hypothetical protein
MGAAGIVAVCAVVALHGWVWAVVAWFGGSALAFALATAAANRRALAGEEEERRLLGDQARDQECTTARVAIGSTPERSGADAAAGEHPREPASLRGDPR